jgi:hypothetical protein
MEPFDFSSVTLPGVGGALNASTAVSSDRLEELNRIGKKWRTDKEGNLYYHNEQKLAANKVARDKRRNLVNRERHENADSEMAMKEIMGRRRARIEAFKELKKQEYNFADDSELMSMPQPFAMGEPCKSKAKLEPGYKECGPDCKGAGKCNCSSCKSKFKKEKQFSECKSGCNCASCRHQAKKDQEYREWTAAKREKLKAGKVHGEFAGPNMSFPIASPQDVSAAWSSVGRASNPREVMANIIKIAQKYEWQSGLPKSVRDRLAKGESGLPSPEFREWPTAKREALQKGEIKGEFAGEGTSFPIAGPKDVAAAWSSVGRADNPKAVMKKIIEIAKRRGWESGLPESVKTRLKEGKSGLPE